MVMTYMEARSVKNIYNKIPSQAKLLLCSHVTYALKELHSKGHIHKNLHTGNILSDGYEQYYIADIGLCKPANEQDEKKIYGVLPYVAPKVLRDKTYTKAADIYSVGILAYEIFSGL